MEFYQKYNIKNLASYKNGVVNTIKLMSTSVRKTITTLKAWMIASWNFIKNRVVALAKGLYTGVKKRSLAYGLARKIFF